MAPLRGLPSWSPCLVFDVSIVGKEIERDVSPVQPSRVGRVAKRVEWSKITTMEMSERRLAEKGRGGDRVGGGIWWVSGTERLGANNVLPVNSIAGHHGIWDGIWKGVFVEEGRNI